MRLRDNRRKKLYTAENESLPEFSKPLEKVSDIEQYNLGTSQGWQIYRHAPEWIRQGQTIQELKSILPAL